MLKTMLMILKMIKVQHTWLKNRRNKSLRLEVN